MQTNLNRRRHHVLFEQLQDERSKRVVFVAHCILNENTRYLGGAFRAGGIDEVVDTFQQCGLGISQMHCPEQRVWGGVLKRYLLPLLLRYTQWRYQRLANEAVRDIEDYLRSGFEVVGIVGVGGSPSCGVWTRLDLRSALAVIAQCPLARLTRQVMNEDAIIACLRPGEGIFVAAIRRALHRKQLSIRWYEQALLDEILGQSIHLQTNAQPHS